MKVAAVLCLATAALVVAGPHNHAHAHAHRRDVNEVEHQLAKRATVIVWVLNGQTISEDDVRKGIENGTLKYGGKGDPFVVEESKPSSSSAAASSSSQSKAEEAQPTQEIKAAAKKPESSSSSAAAPAASPAASPDPPKSDQKTATGKGVDSDFPDGVLSCSDFPDQYGALAVDWMNLGGWAGIQNPKEVSSAGYNDILTVTKAQCNGAQCCLEGSFCSYACPPGYLQFQWPTLQGATGQSVGGLLCKNGKLYKTNPNVSKLCQVGTNKVNVKIQNKLKGKVALCRTSYPGTENMVIPLGIDPGNTQPVACPDADNFYTWKGGKTSAQYYLNPEGLDVSKACQWGNQGDNFGNFAPMVLGVGYNGGFAWLSIQNNMPTQSQNQKYAVEIKGDSDFCKYSNNQYCNSQGCNPNGCTVSVVKGEVTYVLTNA